MDIVLKEKIERVLGGLVVDKRDALHAGLEQMPRFVTEFLLTAARSQNSSLDIAGVRDRIAKYSVDAERKNAFISRLMMEGEARIIARLDIEPKPDKNTHVGRIVQLDGHQLTVSDQLIAKYPELLYGGLWGTCSMKYDTSSSKPQMIVEEFTPYQLTRPDMDAFRRARSEFTLEEWVELLLTSAGYRPEAFVTDRLKLLALSRLVPLVQSNVNLIELGPKGTGKSYLLQNVSSRAFLLAGARSTPANLLYNLQSNQVGIIGRKKVLVFDEIAATSFPDKSLVAALKDYMASGQISRGGRAMMGDCSLVFTGNINLDSDGRLPSRQYVHYLQELPKELQDSALADRIHAFIPGWELPKISADVLADGVGFLSDYFGEVLTELRKDFGFQDRFHKTVVLKEATQRDRVAIEKVGCGLLKMLYPDGNYEEAGLNQALAIAVELRQRVHRQLTKMAPGEFPRKVISFPGMPSFEPPDSEGETRLSERDIRANAQALKGEITILVVFDTGGGDVGFVESSFGAGSGLSVTGMRGPVLEQSVRAAYDALSHLGASFGVSSQKLRGGRMAIHLVDIADPKDGPSAGLAFALGMISAVTGRKIKPGLAVTGELSILGSVGAVGGVAEKVMAAMRHGRKRVIVPADNAADVAQIVGIDGNIEVLPVQTLAVAVALALES